MKEDIMHLRLKRPGIAILFIALVLGALLSCQLNSSSGPTSSSLTTDLYMTDTFSGKVYTYNPANRTVSSTSLVSTTQNATGPIYFYNGIGYIAVGSYSNTAPGVYYFNPLATVPTAVQIGGNVSAQYIAFYSSTLAFVSVANFGGTGGLYTFNPSNPSAGLAGPITGTNAKPMYLQQIVVGPDNMIYVADIGSGAATSPGNPEVIRINPSNNAISYIATPPGSGTTALASGSYRGIAGVFVGNNPTSGSGSVEFIDTATQVVTAIPLLSSTSAYALLYLSDGGGELVTASTNATLLSNTNGTPALTILNSVGGSAIAAQNGLIYVGYTNYANSWLYVFTTSGVAQSYSPLPVMGSGQAVAGLAFYQN
jgi:hypothetical protein